MGPTTTGAADESGRTLRAERNTGVQIADLGAFTAGAGDRVFFAYDSSTLEADARRTLERQAQWLKVSSVQSFTVEGHSDERGTREYNLALGERRANAVRDYLIAMGVSGDRIRTISYGKERPQVAERNESGWAQNRRAISVPR